MCRQLVSHFVQIVGIGTSAGGLEALEEFFSHIPKQTGLAFVVIQHIDPTRKSIMPELLQKVTPIPVSQIIDGITVKSNHVYVIPPNKDLFIVDGILQLKSPTKAHGLRLPIDLFFESLSKYAKDKAVGIIFSGMGSDGSLGCQAIKKMKGTTLAQSPDSAKFDSMPKSAINTNAIDIVATAKELAQNIVSYLDSPQSKSILLPSLNALTSKVALNKIFSILLEHSGNDFSLYKKTTIFRRLERRLTLHQIDSVELYADYLAENPQEVDLLFKELLIGVTNFFRNAEIWEELIHQTIPNLFSRYPAGKNLRAWVTACSTGEEAYTLAMAFHESLKLTKPSARFTLQIFATDLDDNAIQIARKGIYPKQIKKNLSPDLLKKYFSEESNSYRIHKTIREMVVFAPQNILVDPPFTKLDILTCRNFLIYVNPELQKRIIPLFYYALNSNGFLVLGNAETVGDFTHLFEQTNNTSHIYNRMNSGANYVQIDFPTRLFPATTAKENNTLTVNNMNNQIVNLQSLADNVLLQYFAPAAVLINADGDILYINGRTGKYLEPAAGRANWNIYAMAREGLRYEIDLAIKKAQTQKEAVSIMGLVIENNGHEQSVNLSVQEIHQPETLSGTLMIIFQDVETPVKGKQKPSSKREYDLIKELRQAREQVQQMREEMKKSQEELKAANEELQSTNEELQSTNEEVTTSKEEMQSLNEELQTLNSELQSKVDDLTWVNNDMTNLLNSTEIASVFLDNDLNVRRYTTLSTQLFKLISSDIGRPLSDIVTSLDYASLQDDANEVLRTLVFRETQIQTNDDRCFKVRIMPYRTQDNVIDGVVITFTDITKFKALEAKLSDLERSYGAKNDE